MGQKNKHYKESELQKEAISSKLAKKVFEKRYILSELADSYANDTSNPIKLLSKKVSLNKAKHIAKRNKLLAMKAKFKLDKATDSLDKRIEWESNKRKYGERNPSLVKRVGKSLSDIFGSANQSSPAQRLAYA